MRKIGRTPEEFESRNTCQHNGRAFHFSIAAKKPGRRWICRLVITEVILGDKAEVVTVETGVDSKTRWKHRIGCCSLGQYLLVMSGGDDVFAALVKVGKRRLSPTTIHIISLTVDGDKKWPKNPYLCQVTENRALLYFLNSSKMWYCDITGTTLIIREYKTVMPTSGGFDAVPIRLPDGRLLVAGSLPKSTDITLISTGGDPTFEKVGDIPGTARYGLSTVLVKERFVVGFGGIGYFTDFDDLWIFDLQTHQSSQMRKKEKWHPKGSLVPLVVQDDTLYLVGWCAISSIPLSSLARLILNSEIRQTFCEAIGLTMCAAYTKKTCCFLPALSL